MVNKTQIEIDEQNASLQYEIECSNADFHEDCAYNECEECAPKHYLQVYKLR